jgi:hypothetical protein
MIPGGFCKERWVVVKAKHRQSSQRRDDINDECVLKRTEGGAMSIEWPEVGKLTVPFVTAILMLWVKAWVEKVISRSTKQDALAHLIKDQIDGVPKAIDALINIAKASHRGRLRLVSFDVSALISKYACDLSELDAKRAYLYSDLVSSVEIVNKGLARLYSFTLEKAKIEPNKPQQRLDRAIGGQAEITAKDTVTFAIAAIKVLKTIPEKRRNADHETLDSLDQKIRESERKLETWPLLTNAGQGFQQDNNSPHLAQLQARYIAIRNWLAAFVGG